IGRSFVYGLGAMGQQGVNKALEIIQKELETSMALCGCRTIEELSRDILRVPSDFSGTWA
ncbi:MAG: alpha-hydroxy-acid oxidizing protein, partial [Paracoccaceae bacterium]